VGHNGGRDSQEFAAMPAMPIQEVQARLPELIHSLAPGEQVIITEHNLPVAQLVLTAPSSSCRKLGGMRGTITYMADDFDAPLDDFREYMQ
jgi:antitoxin (DNA-binding transcriptional repressor) of toxin-antitoxin stability system